jgi:hypothetical protein
MNSRLTLAMILLLGVGIARAKESNLESAAAMQSNCRPFASASTKGEFISAPQTFDTGICWGAFLAIQEFVVTPWTPEGPGIVPICPKTGTDRAEMIRVFIRYVDMHPQRGGEQFTHVVLNALWEAYPCPGIRAPGTK